MTTEDEQKKKIVNHEGIDTWFLCSRCGVISFKNEWCKPCRMKVFELSTHPLNNHEMKSIIHVVRDFFSKMFKNSQNKQPKYLKGI